jgi:hypothetical protein
MSLPTGWYVEHVLRSVSVSVFIKNPTTIVVVTLKNNQFFDQIDEEINVIAFVFAVIGRVVFYGAIFAIF